MISFYYIIQKLAHKNKIQYPHNITIHKPPYKKQIFDSTLFHKYLHTSIHKEIILPYNDTNEIIFYLQYLLSLIHNTKQPETSIIKIKYSIMKFYGFIQFLSISIFI